MTSFVSKNSVYTGLKLAALAAVVAGLAGCATPADPKAMVVSAPAPTAAAKPFPSQLLHAMCVRNVTGGEATNPMWASKVDDAAFKQALSSSIDTVGLSAGAGTCTYPIDANLLGLSQPTFGFDITVTAHVNYKVYEPTGEPLLLQTVDSPFTATVSDAFVGVKRLQIANEGAIRTSIETLLSKLHDVTPKAAAAAAPAAAPAEPPKAAAPAEAPKPVTK